MRKRSQAVVDGAEASSSRKRSRTVGGAAASTSRKPNDESAVQRPKASTPTKRNPSTVEWPESSTSRKRGRSAVEQPQSSKLRKLDRAAIEALHKRANSNAFGTDFFPKYTTEHARKNRLARITYRRQKEIVRSGPKCDSNGQPRLPLEEKYSNALKGNACMLVYSFIHFIVTQRTLVNFYFKTHFL